jgi:YVTN family beta-propeller protein
MKTPQSHELQQVHINISHNNLAAQHSPPVSQLLYPLMTGGFRNYRYGSLKVTSRAILKHWGFIACLLFAMMTVKAIGQCTPPTVNNISDQVLCNGTITTAIPFTGALAGTTYKWTNNTPSVGLAASGTGDIAAFVATNTTNAPITAMVTVTPSVSSPELAYITNDNDGTVSVINTTTNAVVATVTVGNRPQGVSVSPDGSRVYVANEVDNSVSVINTATNTVVATVPVGTNPFGLSVSPDGSRVYVANKASNSVSVINTATNTVVATVTGLYMPLGVSVSPDGSRVYVSNFNLNTVSVIKTSDNTIEATVMVADFSSGLSVSPDGSRVYVVSANDNTVRVIKTSDNSVTSINVGNAPFAVSVSPDGSRVYVPNFGSNSVSVINTATNMVVATVTVGSDPYGVSVSPDGSRVYVANSASNSISVINTATNMVVATVPVGNRPIAFGNFIKAASTCTGTPKTFKITVNPTPTAVATPSSQTLCSGAALTTMVLSGAVSGTVYNWTRDNTAGVTGIAASGNGDISGALTNTTNAPVTVTFTITPTYTNAGKMCDGTPIMATVVVNPIPDAMATNNKQTICSGGNITTMVLSGTVSGTVFNWTRDKTSEATGIAASGTGNISGALTNTTNAPVTVTFTITPSYTNAGKTCDGTPITATVLVNPTATVNAVSNQVVCNSAPTAAINFSSPTTGGTIVYNWVNNTPSVGLVASGSGNIGAFMATNSTNAPLTATITVTPSYTNGGVTCTGTPLMFTFTVNPTPTVSGPANLIDNNTIGQCGKNIPYNTSSTGVPAPTITYAFTGATTNSGSGNGGGSFFNVGKTTVTLTATNSCGIGTYSFDITINDTEKPKFTACPANITVDNTVGRCDAVVNFTVTASDNCTNPQSVLQTAGLASGSVFPVGETTNSFKATDAAGNASTCTFTVTVKDAEKPVVQCKNRSFDFTYGGSVTLTPQDILQSVSDNCGTIKSLSIDRILPFNGSTIGTFFVTLTATDNANNAASCTANITVTRSELPHVICPDDKVINFEDLPTSGIVPPTTATTNFPDGLKTLISSDKTYNMPCNVPSGTRPEGFPQDANFNTNLAKDACKIVVRTFSATFIGFSSTCYEIFYIKKPDCSKVIKPQDVTAVCINGISYIKPEDLANTNTRVIGTDFPHFSNGNLITDISQCLQSSYTDAPLSNGVIVRTWTIKDDCGNICNTFKQNITASCVIPQITISGAIKRETGGNIAATVKIYNTRDSINKAEGSFYSFPSVPMGESYRVKPERNSDVLNGVTTYDIALISKYILGIDPAKSHYQLIAMDVNRSGEVDAADMLTIRNLILRKSTNFPNNTAWRFIPKSYVFKNPSNPFAEDFPEILTYTQPTESITDADFVAVKVGDANLTARTDLVVSPDKSGTAVQVRSGSEIAYLELENKVLEAGKEYRIPVKTKIKDLIALQFALNLDKNAVESFTIENGDLAQFGDGNYNILDKNTVTTAWASSKATNDNTVFTLVVKVKKQVLIKDLVSLKTAFSDNLGYNTEGDEKHLQLQFSSEKVEKPAFDLHQNRPNPFTQETAISFILPETNNAQLSIFDVTGRQVYTLNRSFSKGYNEVILDKAILQNTGIYFYHLTSAQYSAVKRMQYIAN